MAVLLLQAAQPVVSDPASMDDDGVITVTATRISDLAEAAAACEKNRCSTRQDVAVTVSYASALFDEGKYLDAKRLLAAGVERVKSAAGREPLAVSQIYTAQATLSMHEGDQRITRRASWASRRVLVNALPEQALPRLLAEFRLADWHYRVGQNAAADARYAAIVAAATTPELQSLGDAAALRRALVLNARRRHAESVALLRSLAARPDAASTDLRRAALAMASRLTFENGDLAASNGFAAQLVATTTTVEPMLISAPPMPRPGGPTTIPLGQGVLLQSGGSSSMLTGLRWVDIGFWIKPDGQVDDVAILRGSSDRLKWAAALINYIEGRRYSPFSPEAGQSNGRYRVERYTLTADYTVPGMSLIRRRGLNPRFEMMEMSAAPPVS
jgi:hypothetical protein